MSDPIKPITSSGVAASEAVKGADTAQTTFAVNAPATASANQVQQTDPLQAAIGEVAADVRAGRVPDAQAASDAVIIRLVNLRFGHLGEAQKQKLLLHLHEVLSNDPQFQARIEGLIKIASARGD